MEAAAPNDLAQQPINAVVFDLGGVVLDWNPRHLYRSVFDDPDEVDYFLREICTLEWHEQHDNGRAMAETIPLLAEQHPNYAEAIGVWRERYVDMVGGYIDGMSSLLDELATAGVARYALTNMPAEVVVELRAAFPILDEFDGMIVSGKELVMKPDPEIYRRLTTRFDLDPARTVFVDDMAVNVDAAWELGFRAVRFESAAKLRPELVRWGLPLRG
jgi:2-haloacid dehalogenase